MNGPKALLSGLLIANTFEGQVQVHRQVHKAGASQCQTHTFDSKYTFQPTTSPLYSLVAVEAADRSASCAQLLVTLCATTISQSHSAVVESC